MQKSNAPAASRGSSNRKLTANTTKTPRPSARRTSTLMIPPHLVLHGNPFTASVEGAGRPDFNSLPVVVWRESHHLTLTTNADGNLWYTIRPSLNNAYAQSVLTGGTQTIASQGYATYANYAELAAMFSTYRPLTLAVEAEYVGEAQLAKGVLGIVRHVDFPAVAETMTHYMDETTYKEGPAAIDKVAGAAHYNDTDFIAIAAAPSDQCFSILAQGLPASVACVRLSFTVVFEGTVGGTKLLSRGSTNTIAHPAQVAVAASIVGPKSATAVGPDPVGVLVKHTEKLITTASKVNGLLKSARPVVADLAEFASLLLL